MFPLHMTVMLTQWKQIVKQMLKQEKTAGCISGCSKNKDL
jgi:hypothetical protein